MNRPCDGGLFLARKTNRHRKIHICGFTGQHAKDLGCGDRARTAHSGRPHAWVNSVAASGDGRRLISASDDKTLRVWDVKSRRTLQVLEGHTAKIRSVALTGDGMRAVSGSFD